VWVIFKRHQQNILDQINVGQCCSFHEIPLNDSSTPGLRVTRA
jgi:hypothetical protein